MSAPTDHLAAALAALDDARGTPSAAAIHLARAQVHATLALVEEARTTNLLAAATALPAATPLATIPRPSYVVPITLKTS